MQVLQSSDYDIIELSRSYIEKRWRLANDGRLQGTEQKNYFFSNSFAPYGPSKRKVGQSISVLVHPYWPT